MMTVMCPNCRHRFPVSGCCSGATPRPACDSNSRSASCQRSADCLSYDCAHSFLVPGGCTAEGRCFINAPTIVNGPAVFHAGTRHEGITNFLDCLRNVSFQNRSRNVDFNESPLTASECHITTKCHLTGGSVTITSPEIQAGDCVIQNKNECILDQAPRIEIQSMLTGGGYLLQNKFLPADDEDIDSLLDESLDSQHFSNSDLLSEQSFGLGSGRENSNDEQDRLRFLPPSGCQELPGCRFSGMDSRSRLVRGNFYTWTKYRVEIGRRSAAENKKMNSCDHFFQFNPTHSLHGEKHHLPESMWSDYRSKTQKRHCYCWGNGSEQQSRHEKSFPAVSSRELKVNATVQLPENISRCTLNITATTANHQPSNPASNIMRSRDHFNGGGLIQMDSGPSAEILENESNERRDEEPPTSYVVAMPCGLMTLVMKPDGESLERTKRLLLMSGWYYEDISWQQSVALLKNERVGTWLMRDSLDYRYAFALSVQTSKGPTSIRLSYLSRKYRLDAELNFAKDIASFDCPIKLVEYYIEYSKRVDEQRKEVWVNYSGRLFSQIYLSEPLLKKPRSLVHQARLIANRHKLDNAPLPQPMKEYLAEYPYTL